MKKSIRSMCKESTMSLRVGIRIWEISDLLRIIHNDPLGCFTIMQSGYCNPVPSCLFSFHWVPGIGYIRIYLDSSGGLIVRKYGDIYELDKGIYRNTGEIPSRAVIREIATIENSEFLEEEVTKEDFIKQWVIFIR